MLALLLGIAGNAAQPCPAAPPPRTAAPAAAETIADFRRLIDRDRFTHLPGGIEEWRALIVRLRADPAARRDMLPPSLARLAWSLDYVGRIEEARAAAAEAERLIGDGYDASPADVAEVMSTVSMVEVDAGAVDAGDEAAKRALAVIARAAPVSAAASFAHNAVANVAYARGRYADAERDYAAAADLAMRCLAPDQSDIVNNMASHAGVLYMAGRGEEALAENERAANWALAHLDDASPVVTLALGNLGVMLRSAGRYAEAEAALRRVVDLEAKYQHDNWYYRAISLSNFATVIDRQGRHGEAEALWLQSAEWHRRSPMKRDPATRAYPLRFSADAAQARGDLALALARRREAIRLMEPDAPPDHPELARARIELGRTLALSGQATAGLAIAGPALAIVQRKLDRDDVKRLTAEIDHARIVAAANGAEAGYALIAPIAARLEAKLLDGATGRGDLLRYGPVFSQSFASVVELALATGRREEAFHALQLANLSEIVLVSSEVAARLAASSGAGAAPVRALQDRVRERQSLDRARSFAAADGDAAALARLDAAIHANDAAIVDASRTLDAVFPAYRMLSRPMPVTLAAFRSRLARNQILLAPLPLDDRTLAIAVTREGLTWRRTAVSRARVVTLVERVRASIGRARGSDAASPPFDAEAARALYAALIPPALGPAMAAHASLLYYSAGPLASLPPALMIAPGTSGPPRWLVRDHDITILPTLALAHDRADAGGAIRFLGIGAPEAEMAVLPHAERELRRIGALLGGTSTILTGSSATEAAVVRAIDARYDVIAIATHTLGGGLDGLNEPALVLTPPAASGGAGDGLLTASEVAGLRLDADWVILSACDTASGLGDGSPAYSGLASAFMRAGARALLVSHWPVRDDAAELLTVATVRNARRGMSRSRALQQAMLAAMDDPRMPGAAHPANWAPFVLVAR